MTQIKYVLAVLFCMATISAEESVLIFTYVYNRPDFIAFHVKTFRAFFKEKYEYIVFNDAPNTEMSTQIEQMCSNLKVRCLRVPHHAAHRQHPNCRHMDGIKYSLELLGFNHPGKVMMVDADMFLIKPFSINEYMKEYDFIACYQEREINGKKIVYAGPFVVFMNMTHLPNKKTISFEGGYIEGLPCDTGGNTYYYFENNPDIRLKLYIDYSADYFRKTGESPQDYGCDESSAYFLMNSKYGFQFHADGSYIHFYAGGSNWPNYSADFLREKTVLLNQYIDKQIKYYTQR